tara:strand:+ start:72 stop:197 length:126 start_codon:yes stop_codon:yes gene_type:complete
MKLRPKDSDPKYKESTEDSDTKCKESKEDSTDRYDEIPSRY